MKDQLRDFQLGNQVIDTTTNSSASDYDPSDEPWLKDGQTMGMIKRPEELIERMQEEIESKKSLVENLYPKDVHSLERYIIDLEEIENLSEISSEILDKLNQRIENTNREINTMVEKRMLVKSDSTDGTSSRNVNKMISLQKNVRFIPFFIFQFIQYNDCISTTEREREKSNQ